MSTLNLIVLFLFCVKVQAQDQLRRIDIILMIDGEIPTSNISEGYFIIQDSIGKEVSRVPFDYKVGRVEINDIDYGKISSSKGKSSLGIQFKFTSAKSPYNKCLYKSNIWLNKDYMIMEIYNKSKKKNYEKFDFGKKEYLVQIKTSYFNSIMHYRSDWIRRHKLGYTE